MERVMRMKKALIVILALLLLLTGLFFWKGGHHAIALTELLGEWLDEDSADQRLTLMFMKPDITVDDKGQVKPEVRQMSLNADSFWTEYADLPLFGLTAQGVTAYTDGKTLYMDTGKAYALPDMSGLRRSARQLAWGLLLHGRVSKTGDTYEISMVTEELELYVDITADTSVRSATVMAVLPDDTAIHASMTSLPATPHAIPRSVLDAMVNAKMEPPMGIREPLELLLPALQDLLPLEGDLALGVESGILKLEETVKLRLDSEKAELERKGVALAIDLPMSPAELEPLPAALLLLRHGEFILDGSSGQITVILPPETTDAVCTALVPQVEGLGITFGDSTAVLSIQDGALKTAALSAEGEVPFLVTNIPLSFTAELKIP